MQGLCFVLIACTRLSSLWTGREKGYSGLRCLLCEACRHKIWEAQAFPEVTFPNIAEVIVGIVCASSLSPFFPLFETWFQFERGIRGVRTPVERQGEGVEWVEKMRKGRREEAVEGEGGGKRAGEERMRGRNRGETGEKLQAAAACTSGQPLVARVFRYCRSDKNMVR